MTQTAQNNRGYTLDYEDVTQKSGGKKKNNVGEAQSYAHMTKKHRHHVTD